MDEKKLTDEELNKLIACLEYQSWAQNFIELSKAAYMLKYQKAEIERLKKTNEELYYSGLNENTARLGDMRKIERLEEKNAELQKQVDELTESKRKLELLSIRLMNDKDYQQAVKDTAKEIYAQVLEWLPIGEDYSVFIDNIEMWLKERYGVEVE